MGMKTLRFRGVLCCIMASALLFTGLVCGGGLSTLAAVESVNGSDSLVRTSLTEIKNVLTSISYTDYLAMYESSGRPDETVDIDIFGNINGDETNITYQVARTPTTVRSRFRGSKAARSSTWKSGSEHRSIPRRRGRRKTASSPPYGGSRCPAYTALARMRRLCGFHRYRGN